MIYLTNSDLIYINEAAKALKSSSFIFIRNLIIDLNSYKSGISRIILDPSMIECIPYTGIILNQKEIAKYIKNITVEKGLSIDDTKSTNKFIFSEVSKGTPFEVNVFIDKILSNNILDIHNRISNIASISDTEEDITDNIVNSLSTMKATSGAMYYKHHNKYFMTIFPSVIPMSKKDKLYLSIYDTHNNGIFYANFRLVKPKFTILIGIAYLNTL